MLAMPPVSFSLARAPIRCATSETRMPPATAPFRLKASWGGGGRRVRAVRVPKDLAREATEAKREAGGVFPMTRLLLLQLVLA